eukprot:NODE_1403_length_975_cov_109.893089_g972_i0.p1 GENE.NODE_1403_length_975_cov_109.893089_g972_i0~~NODE_1403_length_975_cov_109.893089_g972_i0.p1  ORF type:complete len:187 (+),score=84.20 NODE_1403_length_975_cov_109.893089_g972_i0:24-563(+)
MGDYNQERMLGKQMTDAILADLKAIVIREETLKVLDKIISESVTSRDLHAWAQAKDTFKIPAPLLAKLDSQIDVENKMALVTRRITSMKDHVKKVFENQSRLRENIKSMEKVTNSSLIDRYLKDLNREEDDLIKTQKGITDAEEENFKLGAQLRQVKLDASTQAKKIKNEEFMKDSDRC